MSEADEYGPGGDRESGPQSEDAIRDDSAAAQTRVTIGPSPFVAWLGWTWTRSRYGRTIQWP